ncbi:MAG: phosphotransferase [Treponemataceae bacterium]|nr:phosphotransferase [Treponemataceae bacterium]
MKKEIIGKGNTAEVYDIGDGKVCKLFVAGYPKEAVEHEYENAVFMMNSGLKVPKVYQMAEENGRSGIIYQKVEGKSLFKWMFENSKFEEGIKILADLHKSVLACKYSQGMNYKDFIKVIIAGRDQNALDILSSLPEGDTLCHGDFHLENILIDQNQNITLIDFMNVCRAPAEYDIARSYFFLVNGAEQQGEEYLQMVMRAAGLYLELMQTSYEKIEKYLEVIKICHAYEMLS